MVSAASAPSKNQIQLLSILAQQTGAALAHAAMHDRDSGSAAKLERANADLEVANRELVTTVSRLQRQTNVHEALSTAVAAGMGEQGIADALNDLTGHSVGIEDRFGNLRCWAGPGQPQPYPNQLRTRANSCCTSWPHRPVRHESDGEYSRLSSPVPRSSVSSR